MKIKLTHRLSVKIIAVILLLVAVAVGGVGAMGIIGCIEMNIYENPNGFYTSTFCMNAAQQTAWHVEAAYISDGLEGAQQYLEDYSNYGNAYIRLIDHETEKVLAKSDMPDSLKGKKFATSSSYSGKSGYVYSELMDYSWEYHEMKKDSDYGYYPEDAVPVFEVVVAVAAPLSSGDIFYQNYQRYQMINDWKLVFPIAAVSAVLVAVVCLIYLLCAAGHTGSTDEIVLNPIDKIPVDLLIVVYVVLFVLAICIGDVFGDWAMILCGIAAGVLLGLSLLLSCATRFKAGKIWDNTVTMRVLRKLRDWCRIGWQMVQKMVHALPLIWKAVLAVCGLSILELFILFVFADYYLFNDSGLILFFIVRFLIVLAICFGVWQLRLLQKGGEELAGGNFDQKIDTKHMYWEFKQHGEHLNSIGDGMLIAVDQRIKSERMKTELITNVSHDIKTPLTSIINYVDLLQRPELTEDERREYLETLARQAKRLKKLTEDLLEASKASTGNMNVHMVPTNVKELLGQAVAEYEEKFQIGKLEVILRQPEENLTVMADGRLLWRVLDNLLGNVSKYALPGTRVYLTAEKVGTMAVISVKNVSRDPLNISEEELMERFVRGDTARSSEGSGLGLNIARSLAQLQHGNLQITIDGDLFKAEITLELA